MSVAVLYAEYQALKLTNDTTIVEYDVLYKLVKDVDKLYTWYNQDVKKIDLQTFTDDEGVETATNQEDYDLWTSKNSIVTAIKAEIVMTDNKYIHTVSRENGLDFIKEKLRKNLKTLQRTRDDAVLVLNLKRFEIEEALLSENSITF